MWKNNCRWSFPAVAMTLAVGLAAGAAPTADAHMAHRLRGHVLSAFLEDCSLTFPFCAVHGKVVVRNNRPLGTGPVRVCVGVDVFTASGVDLSVEPPSPGGQAVARVRPQHAVTTTYRSVFNASAGVADRARVVHVHRHVAEGGTQC
jgi:hypothetical protein